MITSTSLISSSKLDGFYEFIVDFTSKRMRGKTNKLIKQWLIENNLPVETGYSQYDILDIEIDEKHIEKKSMRYSAHFNLYNMDSYKEIRKHIKGLEDVS